MKNDICQLAKTNRLRSTPTEERDSFSVSYDVAVRNNFSTEDIIFATTQITESVNSNLGGAMAAAKLATEEAIHHNLRHSH